MVAPASVANFHIDLAAFHGIKQEGWIRDV